MIIELTGEIVKELVGIPEVLAWVAKLNGAVPNISANKLPARQYPCIAVYEIENVPAMYADDQEETSMISFQISLFSQDGSHAKVQNIIDKKMEELGFLRGAKVPLLFDDNANVTNRVLLYSQEFEQNLYQKEGN